MAIADDITAIKNHVDTTLVGANAYAIIKAKIEALTYYRDNKVTPGKRIAIQAVSAGGSFNPGQDADVAALNVEIASLNTTLQNNLLPAGLPY